MHCLSICNHIGMFYELILSIFSDAQLYPIMKQLNGDDQIELQAMLINQAIAVWCQKKNNTEAL